MSAHLDFLLSRLYDDRLADEHAADLHKSGLTDATIQQQKIRTIPPHMIDQLLGFDMPKVQHAYLIPFPDPRGGWMEHVRMKVFPSIDTESGTIKYLQPRRSGVRIYFPLATLDAVLHSTEPLYVVEGEKKSLSVAQLGLPAVGICGVEGWHAAGARDLHPDLDDAGLTGRVVYVVPDSDARTNVAVGGAVRRLGHALAARGAEGRVLLVPDGFKGIDDYLAATA
jgi:uncharacterized protein DUF3854